MKRRVVTIGLLVVIMGIFGTVTAQAATVTSSAPISGGGYVNSGPGVKKSETPKEAGWIFDQTQQKWWFRNADGSYPKATWQWLDGNKDTVEECYYFDDAGWMLANTTTPDGYTVNADGAWTENGAVQSRSVGTAMTAPQAGNSTQNPSGGQTGSSNSGPGVNQLGQPSHVFTLEDFEEIAAYGRSLGLNGVKPNGDRSGFSFTPLYIYDNDGYQANGRKYFNDGSYIEIGILWEEGSDFIHYTAARDGYTFIGREKYPKAYSVEFAKAEILRIINMK